MSGKKDDILDADNEFEKLLQDFINTKLENEDDDDYADSDDDDDDIEDDTLNLTESAQAENDELSKAFEDDFSKELSETFSEARNAIAEDEKIPQLGNDESELAQAFINFQSSINKLSNEKLNQEFECRFNIDELYPNYKPSRGRIISDDLVAGWRLLCKMFPDTVGKFSPNSSDEEFLNFAEKLRDQNLQLAVISYVEILIDIESCELSYLAKLAQYQERHIKRIMYEEYLARKERQQRFIEALKKKNFPVDAERLITNYFRVAQKDVDGAYRALTTNPAIFAPIDFSKIKPRFFGLVKVTPKDGIRINIEIGNFLKKLKV